jgi:hypothetical protein
MKDNQISLSQWLVEYDEGKFDSRSIQVQCAAGWYDWFCGDKALHGKLNRLAPKVRKIAESKLIDPTKVYVWFKNNCPMIGSLYDDFRIADLETGDTLWTIVPRSGHTVAKGRAELWGSVNNFAEPVVAGTWKDVLDYFGVK